jgi:uncharacterized membrane protein YtjA (UPF0391 family)
VSGHGAIVPAAQPINNQVRFNFEEKIMLKWAIVFAIISLIAGIMGFAGVAAGAASIAKVLFFVFLVLFLVFLALGLFAANKLTRH